MTLAVNISPRLAGFTVQALYDLMVRCRESGAIVPPGLAEWREMLLLRANEGHPGPPFDPAELAGQALFMKPLLVTFDEAGKALACSPRTVKRHVAAGELATVGAGAGTRVVVASLEALVADRASTRVAA